MKRLILNHKKCTACRLCEMVCSLTKTGSLDPGRSMVRISEDQAWTKRIHVCVQCIQKVCKEVCLPDALSISRFGATVVDEKKCDGCEKCIGACVNRAIRIEGKLAKICDLCEGKPLCVMVCPTGALSYESLEENRTRSITKAGRTMIHAMGRRS